MKGSDKPEKATLIKQEWLIEPDYQIMVSLPEKHHATFVQRLKDRAWYFAPCLGLSEMNADLTFIAEGTARPLLEEQTIQSMTVTPQQSVEIDGKQLLETSLEPLNLQVIRMPRDLSSKRVFSHANYLVERQGRAIPVITSQAWQLSGEGLEGKQVLFL
jgi:CRISPR-associated protein Cas5h